MTEQMEETGQVIGQIGSTHSPLIIKLDEFNGRRILDIRRYFQTKDTKQLQPTKKGLSITLGILNSLEEIAREYEKEIRSWLKGGSDSSSARELVARSEAADNTAYMSQDFEIKLSEWRSGNFFQIETEGGLNVLIFNKAHPFVASTLVKPNSEEVLKSIAVIIISFKRASYRFDDLDFNYPSLFNSLEYEWGNFLKSYK